MAIFKSAYSDTATLNKCLDAIKEACSTELWLDQFIESSKKKGALDSSMNVLLHWYKNFDNTDIEYCVIDVSDTEPAYFFEDFRGKILNIAEDDGVSHVFNAIGFPDPIIHQLEGLDHDALYELIGNKVSKFTDVTDYDMYITKHNHS